MSNNLLSSFAAVTAATTIMAGGSIAALASPAHGETVQHVVATGTDGLWLHTAPGLSTPLVVVLPESTEITAVCFTLSDTVVSPISDNNPVWLNVRTPYGDGWVSDAYVDTHWSTTDDLAAAGIPSCDTATSQEPAPAQAPTPDPCVPNSQYLSGRIEYTETSEGKRISLTPTETARAAWGAGDGWDSTVEVWHAIQACVPGLYDATADSVWQQLECHQRFATTRKPDGSYATGDTYDLEAWHDPLLMPNDVTLRPLALPQRARPAQDAAVLCDGRRRQPRLRHQLTLAQMAPKTARRGYAPRGVRAQQSLSANEPRRPCGDATQRCSGDAGGPGRSTRERHVHIRQGWFRVDACDVPADHDTPDGPTSVPAD